MMKIAVFCSGNGSNFQAIVNACKEGLFKADIALMVCDNPGAYAAKRAEKEGIKTFLIDRKEFSSKEQFEGKILDELKREGIELICLTGYMRILSSEFVARYKNRILNIHPALLPSFKGAHGIRDAIDYGVKVTGITVHFVDKDMDTGPIILQESVNIHVADTEEILAKKLHAIEHRIYPEAIRLYIAGRLKVEGRKVKVLAAVAMILTIFGFDSVAMFGKEAFLPLYPIREVIPLAPQHNRALLGASLRKFDRPLQRDDDLSTVAYLQRISPTAKADRLQLTLKEFYGLRIKDGFELSDAALLNPTVDIEKPLTREDIEQIRIEGSFKIARSIADRLDSMDMEFAYSGLTQLIDTAAKVVDFREYMKERYKLHLRFDNEEALLRYKKRF